MVRDFAVGRARERVLAGGKRSFGKSGWKGWWGRTFFCHWDGGVRGEGKV